MPTIALADPLRIDNAWVRAMPPGQRVTAAYFTVVNAGTRAITLSGAEADVAGRVALHGTRREGDRVTMVSASWPTLAPGERLELEPGALHLMLEEIERMPAPGERVELCLNADGAQECVSAAVRRDAPAASMQHKHHGKSSEGRS